MSEVHATTAAPQNTASPAALGRIGSRRVRDAKVSGTSKSPGPVKDDGSTLRVLTRAHRGRGRPAPAVAQPYRPPHVPEPAGRLTG
ncbi:hypothetical protein LRD69_01530 [Streptomyces sp. JH14]|uniref:hypothetical protein n=1 Tax=Streptomyces sp. JH14 TaxID=2793630 RepID=UPI0023F897A7|nr:hypothetical protein [Streptomyces sp. JH14]MDF6040869.1 hypothetical protein [Streptomyces sp. JH14]